MILKYSGPFSRRKRKIRLRRSKISKTLRTKFFSANSGSNLANHPTKILGGGRLLFLENQRKQVEKDLTSVKGSLAIEGLILTKEEEELLIANALGQITDEEFDQIVMKLINNE